MTNNPGPRSPPGTTKAFTSSSDIEYTVEAIICRSLHKTVGPTGEHEHHYLIRWDGYPPEDDTWEPLSHLGNVTQLVKEFDAKELPFTVLDIDDEGDEPHYLVRLWMTELQFKQRNRPRTVDTAITLARRNLNKMRARSKSASSENESDESEEYQPRPKAVASPKNRSIRQLISVAGYKSTRTKQGKQTSEYLAVLQENGRQWEAWYPSASLRYHFKNAPQMIAEFRKSNKERGQVSEHAEINEYELERRKNIERNQLLMKELGL